MSGPQAVRNTLRVGRGTSRPLDLRLLLRFPRLAAASYRQVGKLPPTSRLRQAALVRGVRVAAEAYNRGDLDLVVLAFEPDIEYRPSRNLVEAGLTEDSYRGHAGYRAYVAEAAEVWGTETRFEPTELIDLGDQVVVLARAPMRAQASGVPVTLEFAYVATLRNGRVACQQEYHDHAEALAAVGLER